MILFAHNTQFDFKQLNGFNYLLSNNWNLVNFYVRNKVFILIFQKKINNKLKYSLTVLDTMNYVNKKLKQLGKSIGLEKLKVDFNNVSNRDLETYCMRDTEIIYQFIKQLISFLEVYDLSKLKYTSGSLSMNIYRHKFYKPKECKIYIHDWKKAIKLERKSYKGGITDNFKVGNYNDIYKLDINSMYAYIMKNNLFPNKLVFYSHESKYKQSKLFSIFNKCINTNKYGIIANVLIHLPKDKAYILHRCYGKSIFTYGIFKTTLCEPELKFVLKYGTILKIFEMSIYEMYSLFTEFITFFHNERLKAKKNNNKVYIEFIKLIMNTLYGKFGQRDILYQEIKLNDKFLEKNSEIIKLMVKNKKNIIQNNYIVYLGKIINDSELYIIDKKLYRLKQLKINSKDSFVAISSFITSYSRMLLIEYLFIAKRKNSFYVDTDSLFVNKKGLELLQKHNLIDDNELGKFKIEAFGSCKLYAPKFYDFNDLRKCKGIKDDSILVSENKYNAKYKIFQWSKLKSDLKEGISNVQVINETTKIVKKFYDKGKIDKYGNVHPYSMLEINQKFS